MGLLKPFLYGLGVLFLLVPPHVIGVIMLVCVYLYFRKTESADSGEDALYFEQDEPSSTEKRPLRFRKGESADQEAHPYPIRDESIPEKIRLDAPQEFKRDEFEKNCQDWR